MLCNSLPNLEEYVNLFSSANSGYGSKRVRSLTHDTKNALVQTMTGLVAVSRYLINFAGFEYVLLGRIQSDRLEGEFAKYRSMTGSSCFMTAKDVSVSFKKRLSEFSARYLDHLNLDPAPQPSHCCKFGGFQFD